MERVIDFGYSKKVGLVHLLADVRVLNICLAIGTVIINESPHPIEPFKSNWTINI